MKSSYLPIIGIEVHVELKTKSKMFCSCLNKHFGQRPNINICPVCLGLPGALPVPNIKAIEETITIALILNCKINRIFWFDRKNYFYPDLPKGYQISQHFAPIGINGYLPVLEQGKSRRIGISDIHLEEDTGKSLHTQTATLLDYNRSGVPLVEIVSKPEMHSSDEAKEYLKRVQQTIRWLGFSDCDMEKGSMRLEANISVAETDQSGNYQLPKYRVEIKNLNSFRFVERAIDYEISRQTKILESGLLPKQETRGFDSKKGVTFLQRGKEAAKDYRYFPEPDIPPFKFSSKQISELSENISETPWQAEDKLMKLGVKWQWAKLIARRKKTVRLFLESQRLAASKIPPQELAGWIVNKKIASKTKPKELIEAIIEQKNRFDLSTNKVTALVREAISENPKAASDYRQGKTQVAGFLIGQVQKKSQGKADPNLVRKILLEELK